jgi:1-acyl-sn-glycerol-3-phosphate acyltransferase
VNALWQPRSDCGPGCLPAPSRTAAASRARQSGRFVALLGALVLGALLVPVLVMLPGPARHAAARTWARGVLRSVGVRLVARGRLPRRRALLVANHISWLDIVAILAVSPARLVAKHEVRRWPLVGAMAAAGGTIFVDRSRPRQLPKTVAEAAAALRGGGVVAVFPEGTTRCGAGGAHGRGPACGFRPAMFQAAIDAGAVVVPLALGYHTRQDLNGTTAAAFIGEESLWASLRRVVAVSDLVVTVAASPAVHPDVSATRRGLARIAESAVWGPRPVVTAPVPVLPAPIRSPDSTLVPAAAPGSRPLDAASLDLAA